MTNFRLPGPTPLPPAVLQALQRPMIPHRGPAFKALYGSILERLRLVHRTESDVLVWPATGSAGWEIAIVNLLAPGDRVLAVVVGDFGDRFAKVGVALGLDVRRLDLPWGSAAKPEQIAAALDEHGPVRAVFIVHNETSTGVTSPIAAISPIVHAHGALMIVDAVSSASGLPLLVDEWGLDFVLSGSQKAWMCPPGLMIAAIGPRAWAARSRSGYPRFFWDVDAARDFARQGMTPTTPSLSLLYALDAALDLILTEGVEACWARHASIGRRTRAGIDAMGLELFAEPGYESDTVTAIATPAGLTANQILAVMRERFDIELQAGQGRLTDRIVRIGHMGWVSESDIDDVLVALPRALTQLGADSRAMAAKIG